jgi:hypothetical protein
VQYLLLLVLLFTQGLFGLSPLPPILHDGKKTRRKVTQLLISFHPLFLQNDGNQLQQQLTWLPCINDCFFLTHCITPKPRSTYMPTVLPLSLS